MSTLNYKKLFIHNIDYKTQYEEIFEAFDKIGKLRYCDVPIDKNKRLKGYAFVEYFDAHLAEVALSRLNNTNIGARSIKIEYSNKMKEGNNNNQGGRYNDSPVKRRGGDGGEQRNYQRENRRSRSYEKEYSEESKKGNSRSPSNEYFPKKVSAFEIRKQYQGSFYEREEFYDETPDVADINTFLKKTIKEEPTIIETSRRNEKYDGRRIQRDSRENRNSREFRERRDSRDKRYYRDRYGSEK